MIETIDAELSAMQTVVEVLRDLPAASRDRVVAFLASCGATDDRASAPDAMSRVAGRQQRIVALVSRSPDGMTPRQVAQALNEKVDVVALGMRRALQAGLLRRQRRGVYVARGG